MEKTFSFGNNLKGNCNFNVCKLAWYWLLGYDLKDLDADERKMMDAMIIKGKFSVKFGEVKFQHTDGYFLNISRLNNSSVENLSNQLEAYIGRPPKFGCGQDLKHGNTCKQFQKTNFDEKYWNIDKF